ncbi:5-(carboxyamino)imidazole ribonucleotide synthase [Virgibacillus soli]|uniref:N5-carboxyaminoimidazole ribonucleotide synthase n=1 Tax=Paracerasibacillus soli TaxID=480284 RepID=A0ABU5CWC6_9BACI|nr:5-(carboxyamino)imidazole ribonucleotide synthase [Virgibacillus soli]MDY0410555.1 5-(carboxyamino)imidazole ribonucleotide synthase [Virgibacillus soli]
MKKSNVILPPQTIGIIGGGQLGRMMTMAAKTMGYNVAVLDPTENCPTAQVADHHIQAKYDDLLAIQQLTKMCDVVTYEFENVDLHAAAYIEQQGKLPQGAYALQVTQNRQQEKQLIQRLQLPVPHFYIVENIAQCEEAMKQISFPAVIKTCRGGYDGKGQIKLTSLADSQLAIDFVNKHGHCIVEEWLSFDKEISVVFTRSQAGQITFFPIAENEHREHILYKTNAPAIISENVQEKAFEAARILAENMDVVGTFAIEMFVCGEDIYINEMAPRPHNSGHYTIEACNVSQFAQHIRAICGLPLIEVELLQPAYMVNILGEDLERILHIVPHLSSGFLHLYGKEEPKQKRKMGHMTFIGQSAEQLQQQLRPLQEAIQ